MRKTKELIQNFGISILFAAVLLFLCGAYEEDAFTSFINLINLNF